MLKEKRNQLINKLENIISEYGHDINIKQAIGDEFKSRNMDTRDASYTIMGNKDLRTLSDSDDDTRFLFLFTYALNKAIPSESGINISIEDYFTNVEVDRWKNYKQEAKSKNIFPITFENVDVLGDRIWQAKISAQQLNELSENNILLYNFKTQRNPKITAAGERINVDTKKVYEIRDSLIKGWQYPDAIKLNILRDGNDKISYNEKNRTLTVFEGSVINIFDGYHRTTANSLALESNPDLHFTWSLTLTNFSEKQAHDYMVQIDKQKPIKKEYIKGFDYNLPENLVVDSIIDDKLSELAKIMKDDDSYIKMNLALTKKSIIANAVKDSYEEMLGTSSNIRAIARWIVEFTDYLMGTYIEEFITNPYEVKKTSYINDKNMFYGYIALSAHLYNNKNWKTLLKEKMESIDFSKKNELWDQIGLNVKKDANVSTRKKLYAFMKEGVN